MPTATCQNCDHDQSVHNGVAGAIPLGGCGIIMSLADGYCTVCTIAPKPCLAFVA